MAKELILIAGVTATGKSSSLMNLSVTKDAKGKINRDGQQGIFYLGTEANKPLPFQHKFKRLLNGLEDPLQVFKVFTQVEESPDFHTIIIDSINFLLDMYESRIILDPSVKDSRKEWSGYQQFFKKIMQEYVSTSEKTWIFCAHNAQELLTNGEYLYYVPVKGALKNQGLEAYFSNVVYTRRVNIKELEALPYDPNLLTITARDRAVGYKHVFQCEVTKDFANSKIRSPIGCFAENQIFMNNDCQMLLDHLAEYRNAS